MNTAHLQCDDLSQIILPEEILALADVIAENVHNVWIANRMKDGWTYGPCRDDIKRQTPCLVPYDQLSEEEKAYDWNTATMTIKLLISLGFEIKKK